MALLEHDQFLQSPAIWIPGRCAAIDPNPFVLLYKISQSLLPSRKFLDVLFADANIDTSVNVASLLRFELARIGSDKLVA